MIDIAALIHKLRTAPRKVGTFGRGDPDPLDEFAPLMTGEERDWLIVQCQKRLISEEMDYRRRVREIDRLKRTSGEG